VLSRNVERFRCGLVSKAHRLLCHSTLDSRVITKNTKKIGAHPEARGRVEAPVEGGRVLIASERVSLPLNRVPASEQVPDVVRGVRVAGAVPLNRVPASERVWVSTSQRV
jgi:hypothetical protein